MAEDTKRSFLFLREDKSRANVKVRLLGVFRGLAGRDAVSLKLKNATVRTALRTLAETVSPEARKMLLDSEMNDPRSNAVILLNGIEISALDGLETKIKDGDELTVIPIAHGG